MPGVILALAVAFPAALLGLVSGMSFLDALGLYVTAGMATLLLNALQEINHPAS